MDEIINRRSIWKFTDEEVDNDKIKAAAGGNAGSRSYKPERIHYEKW